MVLFWIILIIIGIGVLFAIAKKLGWISIDFEDLPDTGCDDDNCKCSCHDD